MKFCDFGNRPQPAARAVVNNVKENIGGKGNGAQEKGDQQDGREGREMRGGFRPFVSYRNPEDDVIRKVIQDVVKERTEKGLPLFEYPDLKE